MKREVINYGSEQDLPPQLPAWCRGIRNHRSRQLHLKTWLGKKREHPHEEETVALPEIHTGKVAHHTDADGTPAADKPIHTGFLCRGDELKTTIMRTMPGGKGLKHSRRMRCPFCVCFGWRLNDTTGRFAHHECGEITR